MRQDHREGIENDEPTYEQSNTREYEEADIYKLQHLANLVLLLSAILRTGQHARIADSYCVGNLRAQRDHRYPRLRRNKDQPELPGRLREPLHFAHREERPGCADGSIDATESHDADQVVTLRLDEWCVHQNLHAELEVAFFR